MSKKGEQRYIYCVQRLKEILKEYESGCFNSSLAEMSSIIDGLQPEDFAVYGKAIGHMLIDIAQHERFNTNVPLYNQRQHSYESLQKFISASGRSNSDPNIKAKAQIASRNLKTSKHSRRKVRIEKNDIEDDSELADSDSDSDPKCPNYDDGIHFNNDQFYSNYKFKACNKKYKSKHGNHFQNMCSYEMSNDYYPNFPQWIPTVDLSMLKKKKRNVLCE